MKVRKKSSKFKAGFWVLLVIILFCFGFFARGDERGDRGEGRGFRGESRGYAGGNRHFYREGRWYRHGWFGFDLAVSALTVGTFVETLPPRSAIVVVEGAPYYYDNTYYYQQAPEGGYVVVAPPVWNQPQSNAPDTTIVNVPNSKGGYTPVILKRSGNGFIGPQGEYYSSYPSVEQLKLMYGK